MLGSRQKRGFAHDGPGGNYESSAHVLSSGRTGREVMSTQRRKLYTSSSGDSWYLCRGRDGNVVVSHEPNGASCGKSSKVDLGSFLARGNNGPEHQSLRQLIAELVDPSHLPSPADMAEVPKL